MGALNSFSSAITVYEGKEPIYVVRGLKPETEYDFWVRQGHFNYWGKWSERLRVRTYENPFIWKKCPGYVSEIRKYSVDKKNQRITTKLGRDDLCTIIGNTPLPPNKVTSWSIKILKSKYDDGSYIYIGVAPSDIDQNDENYRKCGWYFDCSDSTLWSGPPHNYRKKEYGPRKKDGEYVHTGDSVGVVMDTTKGELSFAVNGVNLGVAYEGIPLDKPLVPCVILRCEGDSVELII